LPVVVTTDEVHDAGWFALSDLKQIPLAKNVIEVIALARRKLQLDG
jgi:hypothetical protein